MGNGDVYMTKVVINNCPKRSGKDAVGAYLESNGYPIQTVSFKKKLIEIALCVSMIPEEEWDERYEQLKDEPWDKLGGLSQRQYLIKISEEWVKPVHGKDYFGKALVDNIIKQADPANPKYFMVTDGGFDEETTTVVENFGINNVIILQWTRHGSNWDGDSRNWVNIYPEITWRLEPNDGQDIAHYSQFVYSSIDQLFNHEVD